jgi:hypothetical protein
MLIQNLSTCSLVLFLDEASEFQQFGLIFFVLDLDFVSPLIIDDSVFDLTLQDLQDLNLIVLEILSVDQQSLGDLRSYSFFRLGCFAIGLPSRDQELMNVLMCTNGSVVDLSFGLREPAATHQSWMFFVVFGEGQEVVQVSDLAEVRADGVQEDQLQLDVSFDQVNSGFVVDVDQIDVLHG